MSGSLVPLDTTELDFFGRQSNMFDNWLQDYQNDWQCQWNDTTLARRRFDEDRAKFRREMHRLDHEASHIQVPHPFVTDPAGNRKMSLRFDCSMYKPEEVHVKLQDNVLSVHAKHVESGPDSEKQVEFRKLYTLPENVDPKALTSTLSSDGVLQIEAPAPPAVEAPKEYLLPVEKKQ